MKIQFFVKYGKTTPFAIPYEKLTPFKNKKLAILANFSRKFLFLSIS